jgi:hypothetical protein
LPVCYFCLKLKQILDKKEKPENEIEINPNHDKILTAGMNVIGSVYRTDSLHKHASDQKSTADGFTVKHGRVGKNNLFFFIQIVPLNVLFQVLDQPKQARPCQSVPVVQHPV